MLVENMITTHEFDVTKTTAQAMMEPGLSDSVH